MLDGPRHVGLDVERLAAHAATLDVEPPAHLPPLPRIHDAVADALAHPVGSPRLADLARGAGRVVIAIPDASRPCPTFLLLPALLDELNAAGVTDDRVRVLVACGLHRTTTAEEKALLAGRAASSRVTVADAQGLRQTNVFLNQTRSRAPAFMNLQLARADLVVAVGVVEPHLYAGFSGGAKTVAIGCAGARTIAWTHDPRFLDRPGVELGRLEGNPFQEVVRELAAMTSLRFALDAVVDEQGHAVALAAGGPAAVAGGARRRPARRLAAHRARALRPRRRRPAGAQAREPLPRDAGGDLPGPGRALARRRRGARPALRRRRERRRRRTRRAQLRRADGRGRAARERCSNAAAAASRSAPAASAPT